MGSRETFGDRTRTHGMTNTRLYGIWCGMKTRCYCKTDRHYKWYGKRGIAICENWKDSFESFANWSLNNGYSDDKSIDRIDANKNYCPENCRWVDFIVQARNRTDTVYVAYKGRKISAREFAEKNRITDYVFVFRRAKKKFSGECILWEWNMIHNTPKDYMTLNEACSYYGVCDATMRKRIKNGKVNAVKCMNRLYVQR